MVSLLPLGEIKVMRLQAGLTQTALAKLAGVSQSLITKIENGKVDPSYSAVQRVFAALENLKAEKVATVREVMRHPIAISAKDSLHSASLKMKKSGISQLPVVAGNSIVGLITEENVLASVASGRDTGKVKVEEAMQPAPPLVSESTPASALPLILKHCPLVGVTRGEKLVGVVTKSDLLE